MRKKGKIWKVMKEVKK